jgi:hypothetical protein
VRQGEWLAMLLINGTYVQESRVDGFTFYLHPANPSNRLFPVIQRLQLYVSWLGIQSLDEMAAAQGSVEEVQHGAIG